MKGFPENLLKISPPIKEPTRKPVEFMVKIRPAVQSVTPVLDARVPNAGPMDAATSPIAKNAQ